MLSADPWVGPQATPFSCWLWRRKFLYPPGMAAAAAAAAASSNDAGASSGLGVGWAAFGSSVRFAPAPANYKNS